MFNLIENELLVLGAEITTREIKQQPELWQETFSIYKEHQTELEEFLKRLKPQQNKSIKIIFTGAGTSQYVGDTVQPYLNKNGDKDLYEFVSEGTTSIVAAPEDYLNKNQATVLVSFARSGNSPESVAAVKIADKYVDNLLHIFITCAPEGELANLKGLKHPAYTLLMPNKANDDGFAMTGSFSCMTLATLLLFDIEHTDEEKFAYINTLVTLGKDVVKRENEIKDFIKDDFSRIVYLGTGSLMGLTREASLKILELTAGKIVTMFDSSMGFRHGPKSFINEKTLVFTFVSNNDYSRLYDIDILNEITADKIATKVVGIGQNEMKSYQGEKFVFVTNGVKLPDAYLALADIMVAQTVALNTSIKVGNTPDTPSPTGTVNRVVKGVTIHGF